ncbi:MAG: PucC family protein [Paracoccaceae bacterium]
MTQRAPHPLTKLTRRMLPFADAASRDLPIGQLLRLSLFQVSVGLASVMLLGTLNRVMIVELSVPAMIVAIMIALPVLIAPFRAFIGFRSDTYRSAIGWKRVPFIWFGSLWQMGGLAVMPFALLVLSGDQTVGPSWAGEVLAALAFLMTGLGLHMTQTAGLALASDRASEETRPRVVALLYVMYLLGMGLSALLIGWLLRDFTNLTLIRVVQGAALAGLLLNLVALWKQEHMSPMTKVQRSAPRPSFAKTWSAFMAEGTSVRLIFVVFLGTMAFNMQDVLLEPYGGEILGLAVGQTTWLTAAWAFGALIGLAYAARRLNAGISSYRLMSNSIFVGLLAFPAVIVSAPIGSTLLFFAGAFLIGLGSGLFAVSTLIAAMLLGENENTSHGLALGAWGASQATSAGLAIALGGTLRDWINTLAMRGDLGETLATPATGYSFVYHLEIAVLIVTLAILVPLVRMAQRTQSKSDHGNSGIKLADFPM